MFLVEINAIANPSVVSSVIGTELKMVGLPGL
jgi:hypothetical protein